MTKLPKVVGQRLQASEASKAHPDPDLIAAFVERLLGNRERMKVLEHLSRCADCRELTSLASTLPATTPPKEQIGPGSARMRVVDEST